ncbi:MAG: GNAT family N-acetyltransferase [Clostridia bacterium]|nr:GNAT family N-acetyltransferase [Clostridia bacterium]
MKTCVDGLELNFKSLSEAEITDSLFCGFVRRQEVDKCFRRKDGLWIVESDPFTDDWDENDYRELIANLKRTALNGIVFGAFADNRLVGFCAVDGELFGRGGKYMDLSNIHVTCGMRRKGVGKRLFSLAAEWAKAHGAEKLYISAHSAIETQAFYASLGCAEASEYSALHTEKEPFDCQLEKAL